MKKIYNIPVYEDAERLGAYLDGRLSEEERHQLELELQDDPEMAELLKDEIYPDWDDDIETDFPGFDWTTNTPIDEIISKIADIGARNIEADVDVNDYEDIETGDDDNQGNVKDADADDTDDSEFDIDDDYSDIL